MKPNVFCAYECLWPFQKINRSLVFNKNGHDVQTRTLGNSSSTSQTEKKLYCYFSNLCLDIKDKKIEVYFNLRGLQH